MIWQSLARPGARTIHHFTTSRALEVFVLQATPFLGAVIAGVGATWVELGRMALLFAGSLALTAHVFVLNDWAGRGSDGNDPRRATRVLENAVSAIEKLQVSLPFFCSWLPLLSLWSVSARCFSARRSRP